MSLVTRILPREEYPRLTGTELEALWPHLPPSARVIVVEDTMQDPPAIVGCWSVYTLVHAEGVWIHPEHQGRAGVAAALLAALRLVLQLEFQAAGFMTAAVDDAVADMILKLGGTEVVGRHFAVNMDKGILPSQYEAEPCLPQ